MKRILAAVLLCIVMGMIQACGDSSSHSSTSKATPRFANWSTVSSVEIGSATLAVSAAGDYLYVTDIQNGLSIINATDLDRLTLLDKVIASEQQFGSGYSGFDYLYTIRVSGNIACIAVNPACLGWCQGDGSEIRIYDITDRTKPNKLATLEISPADLLIEGRYLYVSGYSRTTGLAELTVVDLAVPGTPVVLGSVGINGAGKLVKQGTTILVSQIDLSFTNDLNIQVIDVSNPAVPVLAGEPSSWMSFNLNYSPILVAGTAAYVTGPSNTGLRVLDIADPLHAVQLTSLGETDTITSLALSGAHLYTAAGAKGVRVYDITDMHSPLLVKTIATQTPALFVAVASNRGFYITDSELDASGNRVGPQKLHVFSVNQP